MVTEGNRIYYHATSSDDESTPSSPNERRPPSDAGERMPIRGDGETRAVPSGLPLPKDWKFGGPMFLEVGVSDQGQRGDGQDGL